jgi:hypothetical protein
MVVVVIIGVLSISVIAIYLDLAGKARHAADDGTLGSLRSAVSMHVAKSGFPPPDKPALEALIIPSPPVFQHYSGYTYDPSSGLVTPIP